MHLRRILKEAQKKKKEKEKEKLLASSKRSILYNIPK